MVFVRIQNDALFADPRIIRQKHALFLGVKLILNTMNIGTIIVNEVQSYIPKRGMKKVVPRVEKIKVKRARTKALASPSQTSQATSREKHNLLKIKRKRERRRRKEKTSKEEQ